MTAAGTTVGFIGLGVMGESMARTLLRAGHRLLIYSRSRGPVDRLAADGAVPAGSSAGVAADADIVVTMLPDDAAVVEVIERDIIAAHAIRPGALIVDMSTTSPATAVRVGTAVTSTGGAFVDAPVSGGQQGALDGTLSIMVGGDAADVARAMPLFEVLGTHVAHVGPVGSGQTAKACNQLVVLGTMEIVAEALVLAAAAGLDAAAVRAMMLAGLASSTILDRAGRRMLERDFEPGGRAEFHLKDIAVVRSVAARTGAQVPAFEAAAAALERLVANGHGGLDHAALVTILEAQAGTTVGGKRDE